MEKQGAGIKMPRALKSFIKRVLNSLSESDMFRVSRAEQVALAKRAWFMKHNRALIVKASMRSMRIRLVKDGTYIQQEFSWVNVFDGMSPTDPPKPARFKELDDVLAPSGRDYRYKHPDGFTGHEFTDAAVRKLHLIVLETAVEAAIIGGGAKERQDALRWIFRPEVILHPSPGKPPVKTSRIPFNFRLCCHLAGADPDGVQERVLECLDANEKETYEVFKLRGDGEISRRSLRAERRRRAEDEDHGGRRNAPCGP